MIHFQDENYVKVEIICNLQRMPVFSTFEEFETES